MRSPCCGPAPSPPARTRSRSPNALTCATIPSTAHAPRSLPGWARSSPSSPAVTWLRWNSRRRSRPGCATLRAALAMPAQPSALAGQADIVIAGGGPVGLMLACELRLSGTDPIVLERLPGINETPKGNGLVGQIVPMLDYRGLLDRLRRRPPCRACTALLVRSAAAGLLQARHQPGAHPDGAATPAGEGAGGAAHRTRRDRPAQARTDGAVPA